MADFQRRAADQRDLMNVAASMVEYDPDTGGFLWRKDSPRSHLQCGILDENGYIRIVIGRRENKTAIYVRAHRLAWFICKGEIPTGEIDHINQVRSDNRISNLRDVSRSMNQRNMKKNSRNTSGIPNVTWHKQSSKWYVQVRVNKRKYSLGLYESLDEADRVATKFKAANGFTGNHGRRNMDQIYARLVRDERMVNVEE